MTDGKDSMPWTRRGTLAALAAVAVAPALPALGATEITFPDDALRPYARAVGADPRVAAIGHAAAGNRDADALEASLRARIPGAHDQAGWRLRLLDAGRAELARGDRIEIAGRRLMRSEADFLGLAARLQSAS